ncbi:hypothetical protein [Neisseria weaveri]|uniref:hypothetical protein n=1 Tax=Neisseria weaveri TaxID=28091 RepID=UPI000D3185C7|nr:hypothetical protein [Neisseria weaveri]
MARQQGHARLTAYGQINGDKKMTNINITVNANIYADGKWEMQEVVRKYEIEWHKGYASVFNEEGFYVDDIDLTGEETKEARMNRVKEVLERWK